MPNQTPQEAADALSDFVNGASFNDLEAFAERITHYTHRTLQQIVFGMFLRCIRKWATDAAVRNHDMRNEATCKYSQLIADAVGDDVHLPYL